MAEGEKLSIQPECISNSSSVEVRNDRTYSSFWVDKKKKKIEAGICYCASEPGWPSGKALGW